MRVKVVGIERNLEGRLLGPEVGERIVLLIDCAPGEAEAIEKALAGGSDVLVTAGPRSFAPVRCWQCAHEWDVHGPAGYCYHRNPASGVLCTCSAKKEK